jgi:hypothetical protein
VAARPPALWIWIGVLAAVGAALLVGAVLLAY